MKGKVTVSGLKDLDRSLGQFSKAVGLGVLRRVGRAALEPFDAAWRENAQRNRLTGDLDQSGGIGTKLTRSQRKKHRKESAVELFAGPGPDPAGVQGEFGNAHQNPQPSVRPAWDQTQDEVLSGVAEGLADEIKKTADRVATRAARLARK